MQLIKGDLSVDDRGIVTFVNNFDFKDVKRFYMVSNHSKGFVRAWHGHKKEAKYVFVTKGAIILALVDMEDTSLAEERVVLSANKPQIAYIPAGKFNGFKTLTDDTQVIFFSTATMEETKGDDYRRSAEHLRDLFDVEER